MPTVQKKMAVAVTRIGKSTRATPGLAFWGIPVGATVDVVVGTRA
jgi:hypothetical protein